jgi:hypothetical protein
VKSVLEQRRPTDEARTPPLASLLRTVWETLDQLRSHHRRRLPFLSPAMERRRPRIAAEDYAARHSIEHTLDRKAELRRLAPTWPEAAKRYHQLLTYELAGLREVVAALESASGGRDLQECIAENRSEIERLEVEVAWCAALKAKPARPASE